jgi:thiamine-phosphate pyrophosphorylase
MSRPIDYSLYLVTDRSLAMGRGLTEVVSAAVQGGVTVVQLREKGTGTREFLALAQAMKALLDPQGIPLIVNDRLDLALACDAAGVHLGQEDMPCHIARRLLGSERLLGVSVSTPEEAHRAEREGADYLGVSPIFVTPTKRDTPAATGLAGLRLIRAATHLPLVAIGGLSAANAAAVMAAGADGIAVVSALMAAPDPRMAARELRNTITPGGGHL